MWDDFKLIKNGENYEKYGQNFTLKYKYERLHTEIYSKLFGKKEDEWIAIKAAKGIPKECKVPNEEFISCMKMVTEYSEKFSVTIPVITKEIALWHECRAAEARMRQLGW